MKDLIQEFIQVLRVDRGASRHTLDSYERDLVQFSQFLPSPINPAEIQAEHLKGYFDFLQQNQLSPSSQSRKMSSLRQFFKFCCLEKGLEKSPMDAFENPKNKKKLPKDLSPEEIEKLLDSVKKGLDYPSRMTSALQARDRAMVTLLYATGMRVTELVSLRLNDLDLQEMFIRVKGKGGKERLAPFVRAASDALYDYLGEKRELLSPQSDHVFLNERGGGLSRQGFWKCLKKHCRQAGLSDEISPHRLRHAFATHLLHSGIDLRSLQLLLGHADLSTTQIYTHLKAKHLKEAHQKFHPRGDDES